MAGTRRWTPTFSAGARNPGGGDGAAETGCNLRRLAVNNLENQTKGNMAMTKTSLIIQRDLKADGDFRAFNEEVEKIVKPFGARFIGCGTLMTSLTRDWQYEVDIGSAHIVA
jgi:hypothetical protein